MVVKGSKQFRPVVIHYRPLRRWVLTGLFLLLVAGIAFGCYRSGYSEAQRDYQLAMQEWNRLHELSNQQAAQLQQLNQQIANSQVGSSVSRQVVEQLRQEIIQLNEQISGLQESNNFYRQLMESPVTNNGVAISSFKVIALKEPRHYHYEVLIQQLTRDHRSSTGKIAITIVGMLGDQPHHYSIAELSDKPIKADIPLKLRFYQTVTGDVVLPDTFEANHVEISAEMNGGKVVTENFDWVVKN